MNIRFEYLYRDSGNYKNWGSIVFSNPQNEKVEVLTERVRSCLIDHAFFVAAKAGVPDLHFDNFDEELDHGWHEFAFVEYTLESPNDTQGRNISQFLLDLKSAH